MPQRRTRATAGGNDKKKPAPRTARPAAADPEAAEVPVGPFRLGAVEGATPGKWIDTWQERMPRNPLELVALGIGDQRTALAEASVDAALVRLPIERAGLHVIELYREVSVVVCGADSHLTAADELSLQDLAGEILIVPQDPPIQVSVPGSVDPLFDPPETIADAIATVAAGVGIVVVPMSLARLHRRKDIEHRPLTDGPESPVALVWPEGATSPLVEAFVGIVRGRTANSSR